MPNVIKDGKGRGYQLEVNTDNKAMVFAVNRTEESEVAELHESAFSISTRVVTLNSTNPHLIMWSKNTSSSQSVYIWNTTFGWNGGSTNHNRTLKWSFVLFPNEPTANHVLVPAGNLNLNSALTADAVVYIWNGVGDGMTYTGGIVAEEMIFGQGMTTVESHGVPIAGLNTSIGVLVTGEEIGDVVVTTRFFYKDIT